MTFRKKQKITPKTINDIVYGTKEYENQFYSDYIKYTQKITDIDCKAYTISYLKSMNKYSEYYNTIHPKKFNPYGIYIKMQSDGILLPDVEKKLISEYVEELDREYKDKIEKKENTSKQRSVHEFKKIKQILSSVELYIDTQLEVIGNNKKTNSNITDIITQHKIRPEYFSILINEISTSIDRLVEDLQLAKNKKDQQLIEGYSYLTPKQLTEFIDFLNKLQSNINFSSKKERKKRKIKPKSPERLVKNLKIQENCPVLGIFSVTKTDILGANIVYTYNTKTRFLNRYLSDSSFSIKGSTLLNVQFAIKKKIRKPQLLFSHINQKNKKFMETLWNSIKEKELPANTRLSKVCIVLSTFTI